MTDDRSPLEEMLRWEPVLARIARDIVAPADVPDVLQRTWLAAIRGPAPERASLGAWLARVARNFAYEHRRRETSRAARERRVAERVDAPGLDDAPPAHPAHWESVVAALRDLEPPYRRAIERRYLEGMPYARIAQETGIGEAAARQRVKRGLDRLRVRLLGGTTKRRAAVLGRPWPELARLAAAASVGALLTLVVAGDAPPAPVAPVALRSDAGADRPVLEEHYVFLAPPAGAPARPAAPAAPGALVPEDRPFGRVPLATASEESARETAPDPGTLADASL